MQISIAFGGVDHFRQTGYVQGEVRGGHTRGGLTDAVVNAIVNRLQGRLVAGGLDQPVGRIEGVGHHPGVEQVAIVVKGIALPIDAGEPVSGVIQVGGGVAVDDLL